MSEETKAKEVTFLSRYLNLRIVMKPGYSKEVDGRRVSTPGESIRFEGGKYTTSNEAEIEFLRNRPEFGKHIQEVPSDVEDLNAEAEKRFQNLEEREAAADAREAALAKREQEISDAEAGRAPAGNQEGGSTSEEGDEEDDGLEALERGELTAKLKEMKEENPEGLEDVNGNSKSEDIIAAIRKVAADRPAFDE